MSAPAQCGNFAPAANSIGNGDDFVSVHYALAAPFTMAGSAGTTTWTHFVACSNGWIALTDGVTATGIPSSTSYGSVAASTTASLYGPAGSNPRIMPFFGDLESFAPNGLSYETIGSQTRVVWSNVVEYGNAVQKSFEVLIDSATGAVKFSYDPTCNVETIPGWSPLKHVGISPSNGTPVNARDYVPGPQVTATGGMHQSFGLLALDLGGRSITFTPNGAGWNAAVTCQLLAASHSSYGSGCYNSSDSVYQAWSTAAAAAPVLSNTALTFTPSAGSYLVTAGGTFLPVGSVQAVPTIVANSDDTEQVVPFTAGSFPGSTGLAICSNGFVSLATGNSTTWNQSVSLLLNGTQTSFRSAHDMNPTLPGSGQIKYEESAAVTVVTYDGVWDYGGTSVADANTIQFQLYQSGVVTIVWGSLSPLGASGIGFYVGYSPGGASADVGPTDFATQLPYQVSPLNTTAMALAAAPAPVSTGVSGTLVTYTQSNIPEAAPTSGVYLGATILSLGQDLPGASLSFIGMPGCKRHVASLDLMLAFVGNSSSLPSQFQVPAGVPYGFQVFAQSVALITPFSLPGGQNAFGATVSNGVASFISGF
ncbi:MAG TPA: hypothetical protein VFD82_00955 [Planctomycetota bacterium]|nr:hypothetical protein [Planctomycetota bacterium]